MHRAPSFRIPSALFYSIAFSLALAGCSDGGTGVEVPALQVTASTTGSDLDPDGYTVTVDGGAGQAIASNGPLTVATLSTGDHTVQLSGVSPNCQVQGQNPLTVTVQAGATATADFVIVCSGPGPGPGSITVSTATGGDNVDPDGYTLLLDGAESGAIAATATVRLGQLAAGPHTIGLGAVAANCLVAGDNPQNVTVAGGSTTPAAFAITCTAGSGSVATWTRLDKVVSRTLEDVWGTGADNMYAVGHDKTRSTGTILHYDGTTWSEQQSFLDIALQSVWGAAPNDVFAVGSHIGSTAGAILHFDGTAWSEMTGPSLAPLTDVVIMWRSVWGSSGHDVYAVGARYRTAATPTTGLLKPTALVAHYNGTAWSLVQLPSGANREILDVWGTSDRNVYLVGDFQPGDGNDEGIILHFDGTGWTESRYGSGGLHLKAAWGTAANDIFAVGDEGTILHFDGTAWTSMPTTITKAVHEIWGSSASDVVAVAARGIILHYDGTSWSEMVSPTDRDLFGVWGSGPGNVFATGLVGVILHGTP
ncbi:MAG: hypothetical protein ABI785_04610 [Gemmatimonadales bacterium]